MTIGQSTVQLWARVDCPVFFTRGVYIALVCRLRPGARLDYKGVIIGAATKRSKVKVARPINAVTENHPYLRYGKVYELRDWYGER